jgi:hypothetical protein
VWWYVPAIPVTQEAEGLHVQGEPEQLRPCLKTKYKKAESWTWWWTSVIPALRRLPQENLKFKASLGYIVGPCLKRKKNKNSNIV